MTSRIVIKRLLLTCLAAHLLLALTGCVGPRFPEAPLKRVKGFSLGSAKIEALGDNAQASEVYDVAVRLFDSLESAAATYYVEERMTPEWATAFNRPVRLAGKVVKARVDFRYARPDKVLIKRTGDEPLTTVQNGTTTIIFQPESMTYRRIITSREIVQAMPPSVTGWLQLLPDGRNFEKMVMVKSETDGTKTYTLELCLPAKSVQDGYLPAEKRTFYLGRKDLLPRKVEILRQLTVPKRKEVATTRLVLNFSGFHANEKLPPGTFSTKPPKGARESLN